MSERGRTIVSRLLLVVACLAAVLALVAGYVRHAAVDSDQFANRATAALRDDAVRSLVATRVTDDVVLQKQADLLAVRPLLESVTQGVIGSPAFTGLFRAAVRDVHRAVFDHDQDTVTLTMVDVGTVVAAALDKVRPKLGREVDATGPVTVVRRDIGTAGGTAARIAGDVRLIAWLALALALAAAAGAIALAADRRRAVVALGVGVAVSGAVLIVAYAVARSIVVGAADGPEQRAAAGAVWDAFLEDLRTEAWIMAGAGAVVAAAAATLIRPVELAGPLRRAAHAVAAEPRRPALRAVRGVAFVAAGVLAVVTTAQVVDALVTVAGVLAIYVGVAALLRLVAPPEAEARRAPATTRRPRVTGHAVRRAGVIVIAGGAIALAIGLSAGGGAISTAAPPRGTCNGHAELCDRPLDEVTLAATHNSMSVPLPGWYASQQDGPIADQLAYGVRGLLIDTHYADRLPDGRVRTYFGETRDLRRQAEEDGVSADAVDAAQRIRDRLGFSGEGQRGMYLCHSFCELGATPLASALDDLHKFLVTHPGEVVVVINQDYVTPQDFVAAVQRAGLAAMAYAGPANAGSWPTLGEMIDSGKRVVFLAENRAGAAPWYRPAYTRITQETPFHFTRVAQLTDPSRWPASCAENRGPPGAPLFLMNHWITTDPLPLPSQASQVNAYNPLLGRARECEKLRDHRVNLVAVNFYRRGDLLRVVDVLNGVR